LNFDLTSEQQMLLDSVQRFVKDNYSLIQRDEMASAGSSHWSTYAELGWLGVGVPEEFGGNGRSFADIAVIGEALGQGLILEPHLGAGVLAPQVLLEAAAPDQCRAMLPGFVDGSAVFALANMEDAARGRLEFVETTASKTKTGYVIDGHKTAVLGAQHATELLVAARTSGDPSDRAGITLFRLDRAAAGLRQTDYRMIDGTAVSDIRFEGVVISDDAVIGAVGGAYPALEMATQIAIMAAAAYAVGSMTAALSQTCEYLQTRRQFGSPLSDFQALRHRIADMQVALELARSNLFRGLAGLEMPDRNERAKAVHSSKIVVAQASRIVGGQAVQLHGGIGVTEEYAVGHHFKQLMVLNALFGTDDFHVARLGELI
jgi:alkylation response protein AidB-like acyl-CoA dehydrogenase